MSDLALLVPSRGRPHNIARLIEAMDLTCRGDTTLVVGRDSDDPVSQDYDVPERSGPDVHLLSRHGFRGRLVSYLNTLAVEYADDYRFIGHIGDDNVPRTVGWDVKVAEALEDNLFCFGDDLDPGRPAGSLSLTIFMQSQVVKKLGYMGPPKLQHMYVDPVWYAWGLSTSIKFLPDVILEHMHYTISGKAPHDESYGLSTSLIPEDCQRYNDYCQDGMNADIEKLGGVTFTDEELREFNRKLNIPSRWGEPVR